MLATASDGRIHEPVSRGSTETQVIKFERTIQALAEAEADFIVIGGFAAILHGSHLLLASKS